jgi:polyvinyl alcohol dehydrogenase (cytochrome)
VRTSLRLVTLASLLAAGLMPSWSVRASVQPTSAPSCQWPMYGGSLSRTFASTCPDAPTVATARTLVPRWFVHMPDVVTASPTIVAGRVYVGDWAGNFDSLDVTTGAALWTTVLGSRRADGNADGHRGAYGTITSSAAVATVGGRSLAFVGAGGSVYALDTNAATPDSARVVWRFDVDPAHPTGLGEVESSPAVWRSPAGPLVIFGADANQSAGFPGEGLWAVDARTGAVRWHFNPEAATGHALYGCGNIWSSPAISLDPTNPDPARRALAIAGMADCPDNGAQPCPADGSDAHCAPGQSYDPAQRWQRFAEAIVAVDAVTGHPVWSYQPHPEPNANDDDFGASAQLFSDQGRRVVGEGSKDGWYYTVDRNTGMPVWAAPEHGNGNIQPGFAVGGFIGTPAVAARSGTPLIAGGSAIDTPVNATSGTPAPNPDPAAGATPMRAFSGSDGSPSWSAVQAPMYGPSTVANGVLYAGALDAVLRAYDVSTGTLLAALALSGPISSGAAVAGDMVVIGAGTNDSDVEFKTCERVPDPVAGVCRSAPLDASLNPLSNVNGVWGLSPA